MRDGLDAAMLAWREFWVAQVRELRAQRDQLGTTAEVSAELRRAELGLLLAEQELALRSGRMRLGTVWDCDEDTEWVSEEERARRIRSSEAQPLTTMGLGLRDFSRVRGVVRSASLTPRP